MIHGSTDIIAALRNKEMVVIMDDEDRENEGDLVKIAEYITPNDINFMAQYGRGLICLTLTKEYCKRLNLPLMTRKNKTHQYTNFTVSIEATQGVTTGISAADRAHTIQTAVAQNVSPDDICSPGHVFPLQAVEGGVLSRAGHTEAGCDLAHLAGCAPASVIVEILNPDGSMARRTQLETFAATHNIKIGTINDLIAYRFQRERTIKALSEHRLDTRHGMFVLKVYQETLSNARHIALIKGAINPNDTLVRVHGRLLFEDVIAPADTQGTHWSLDSAMAYIATQKAGVIVILDQAEMSLGSLIADRMAITQKASRQSIVFRDSGIGSQILQDVGVQKMRLLGEPFRYNALSGFGLDIIECISFSEALRTAVR